MLRIIKPRKEVLERIKAKTVYKDGHFLWTGKLTGRGYGNIWFEGRMVRIGRLICFMFHGVDLKDLSWAAAHKDDICRFTNCWNPEHIYPASHTENAINRYRVSRQKAEKHA